MKPLAVPELILEACGNIEVLITAALHFLASSMEEPAPFPL